MPRAVPLSCRGGSPLPSPPAWRFAVPIPPSWHMHAVVGPRRASSALLLLFVFSDCPFPIGASIARSCGEGINKCRRHDKMIRGISLDEPHSSTRRPIRDESERGTRSRPTSEGSRRADSSRLLSRSRTTWEAVVPLFVASVLLPPTGSWSTLALHAYLAETTP